MKDLDICVSPLNQELEVLCNRSRKEPIEIITQGFLLLKLLKSKHRKFPTARTAAFAVFSKDGSKYYNRPITHRTRRYQDEAITRTPKFDCSGKALSQMKELCEFFNRTPEQLTRDAIHLQYEALKTLKIVQDEDSGHTYHTGVLVYDKYGAIENGHMFHI